MTVVAADNSAKCEQGERQRWPRVPLDGLCIEAKSGFAIGERADEGVVQVRMNNVDTRGHFVWASLTRVPADFATITQYRLFKGDVLFNNTNSTALVGKSALFESYPEPLVFSNHFTRLRTDPVRLLPNYLAWWLNHEWRRGTFAEICNKWIGQSAVKPARLLALEIPLPPLIEQMRIASDLTQALAAVDAARLAAEDRLTAAEALPAAYLRGVFETPDASRWGEFELGALVRSPIRTGISKPGSPTSNKRCLTLSAVRGRTLLLEASKPVDVSDSDAEGNWLQSGCFYVVRGNGNRELVGRGAFAPDALRDRMLFPDLLFQLDLSEAVDPTFFWYLWCSAAVRREIEARARTAAGIYKINTSNLASLPLRLPAIAEQRLIACDLSLRVEAADSISARCREELAAIDALPASMLRAAFNGGS